MPQHADNIYDADQKDDLTPARNTKQELPWWPIFLFVSQDTNNSRFGGKLPSWIYFSLFWFPLNSNLKSQGIKHQYCYWCTLWARTQYPEPIGHWPLAHGQQQDNSSRLDLYSIWKCEIEVTVIWRLLFHIVGAHPTTAKATGWISNSFCANDILTFSTTITKNSKVFLYKHQIYTFVGILLTWLILHWVDKRS